MTTQPIDWLKVNEEARANDAKRRASQESSLVVGDQTLPAPGSNSPQVNNAQTYKSVEPYIPLINKWWLQSDVGKAIHTAFWEMGDRPHSALEPGSDGATGIFRIQNIAGRPSPNVLMNSENNVKYASWIAYGRQGNWENWRGPQPNQKASFREWGDEGATWFNPKTGKNEPFGALSVHPFPGDTPIPPIPPDYEAQIGRAAHDATQNQLLTKQASEAYDEWLKTWEQRRNVEIESNVDVNYLPENKGGRYKPSTKTTLSSPSMPFVSAGPDLLAGLMNIVGIGGGAPDSDKSKVDEASAKAAQIQQKYENERNTLLTSISQAQRVEQKSTQWEFILKTLPNFIADPKNHISNVDELEKYLSTTDPNTGEYPVSNRGNQAFSEDQRAYLDSLIKSLYPQIGKPGQTPSSQSQLAQYLANVKKPTASRRISIAGLSSESIKQLLTTVPSGQNKLPDRMTKEEANRILSAQELASEESKKAFKELEGSAKPLLDQWQSIDNQYKAWQLGMAIPNINLEQYKARSQSIGLWALDKLEVYAANWTRPAAAYGLTEILPRLKAVTGYDLFGVSNVFQSILPDEGILGIPGFIKGTLYPNTDDLRKRIETNKAAGMNWWEAGSHGFQDWDANFLVKMFAEGAVDPTSYLGFGMYTKVTKPLGYFGRSVAAIEEGWKVAFENPLVTRAGLVAIGAGVGYQEGGEKGALIGAATIGGLPLLRGIPLYTVKQLTERYRFNFLATLTKGMTTFVNRPTLEGATNEEVISFLNKGLQAVQVDPLTAHNSDAGALVKEYLDHVNVPVSENEVGQLTARIADALPSGLSIGPKPSQQVLNDLQHYYDMLFHSTKRGVMSVEQVAENWAKTLSLPKEAIPEVEAFLKERIDNSINIFKSNFADDGVQTLANISTSYTAAIKKTFEDPSRNWGRFQGLVIGLNRKLEPIERNRGYRAMDWLQTHYAQSALLFTTFKPFNYIETHFRAGIAGGGWSLPVTADEIIAASEYHAWHPSYPWALRDANRRSTHSEIALVTKDHSSLTAIQKKKNLFVNVKDWVVGDNLDRIGFQKATQAYNKFVIDEFARINPDIYGQLITLQDKARVLLKNSGIPDDEVSGRLTDLLNFSLRPDGPELIRNQMTDLPTYEKKAFIKEAGKVMAGLEKLDTPYQNYILRRFERGEWNNVDQIIDDLKPSLYDHYIAKSEIAQEALTNQADLMVKSLQDDLSSQQVGDHIRTMAELEQSSADIVSGIYAVATKRAQTITGDNNKNVFWETANKARAEYIQHAEVQFGRMRDALNAKVATFPVDQQPIVSDLIQNIDARLKLATKARDAEQQVYNDFIFANKRRPHGDEWMNDINPKLAQIWEGSDGYFAQSSKLYSDYNDLAGYIYNPGTLPNVTGGLTIQHLSQMYSASADSIAESMVQFDSLMRKETFVGNHYGTARRLARKIDPTKKPEDFGFSEEELGKLYDNLRVRMNTNPSDSPTLRVLEEELRGLKDDLNILSMTKGKTQDVVDATNSLYRDWADSLEGMTRSEVRINDLTPEPIITTRGTPRKRRPTHAPGTNVTYDLAPTAEFTDSVNRAYEMANLRYRNTFTDYTHQNIFDAFLRGIFPFWNYEAQRWPYLFRTAGQHPGFITSWGRFQDYTEDGYVHIGNTDLSVNFLRGTVLQGGLSGLVRQFPARYETGLYGSLSTALETMGRGGFYPGLWATLPLVKLGVTDFDVPLPVDTLVNASALIDPKLAEIRNDLFPNRFREFYISDVINKEAQINNWDFNGDDARILVNSPDLAARQSGTANPLTDKEERMLAAWRDATGTVAKYQLLFDQTGIFKLDIEEKRKAARLMAEYIQEKTGVSVEQQDALTDRLRNTGLRLTDILPLDPKSQEELYNSLKFKYWAGNHAILPKPFQAVEDQRKKYYSAVDAINADAKTNGFRDKDNKLTPSLASLDADFKSGKLTAREWISAQAATKQEASARIRGLSIGDSAPFANVPITLDERQKWASDHNQTLPVDHPAKELANLYYSIKPIEKNGEIDWLQYFGSIETLLTTLPEDRRYYLMDFIQRDWTDTQRLYWKTSSQYIRPYQNVRELILQNIPPEQRALIDQYEGKSDAVVGNLPEEAQKLVKDFNSAVSRGRGRYLELNPESNAWNYYWGKVTTLHTEASRIVYNQIVSKYGGGVPVTTPIEEKKSVLPALPTNEEKGIKLIKDSSGRTTSVVVDGVERKVTR